MNFGDKIALLVGALLSAPSVFAATELPPVQVTATREAEPVETLPASLTIISGDELRARGANDLRTALALVGGVEGTPGGDGGPAGSVPALLGLREVDAFLLVIDGVPAGGAFNPSTVTVDMTGVERIEVLRGAAPVMYGATSFNGVIHVIHYAPGTVPAMLTAGGSAPESYGTSFLSDLPAIGGYQQSLTANFEKRGYKTDRERYERYHVLYRGGTGSGFHVDADYSFVPQAPSSLLLRVGRALRTDINIDDNQNPSDARLDQTRGHLALGYDTSTGLGNWGTTLAFTRTTDKIVRGFLRGNAPDTVATPDGNDADGFTQSRQVNDVYFDTHLVTQAAAATFIYGLDYLYGRGKQTANNYAYFVSLDGSDAPATENQTADEIAISSNHRDFVGLYAQTQWHLVPQVFDVLAGLRLNRTTEVAAGQAIDNTGPTPVVTFDGTGDLTKSRLSGVVGATWHAWRDGNDALSLYADYRNTYKPLATDFGPEAEVQVLQPETANNYEIGARGRLGDGRFSYDLSAFQLDFKNGLTFDSAGMRANGGKQRFKGVEVETRFALAGALQLAANYAYHDSRFVSFVTDDGTDVSGNRLEMAPYHVGSAGLLYTPDRGFNGTLVGNYAGERKLNKKNTVDAGGYTTLDASLGYQFERFGIRLNGYNLTDKRVPVAESELQELATRHDPAFPIAAAGFYVLPARSIMLNFSMSL